jgi:uncharacterized repeat protein (TIGR01451 family)
VPLPANCTVMPGVGPASRFMTACNIGTLEAASTGTSGREVIEIKVTAVEAVDINDLSRVISVVTPDPDFSNNTSLGSISVEAQADLQVSKTAPATAVAGTQFTYSIEVVNNGPSTAVNVLLEDTVPAGVVIDAVGVSIGTGSCNAGVPGDPFQPTSCDLGTLADGASKTVEIDVTVLPGTPAGTILHNDVRVSSDTADMDNSNDLDSTDTTVEADADLSVVKSDSPDPVVAGSGLTYSIDVTNNGPSTAIDVMITDLLPPEVTFVGTTISNGSGTCVWLDAPSRVECDLNDLDPGEFVTVFIDVIVNADTPDGTITNEVSVSSATPDSNGANDSETEDTTVVTEADLDITKGANFVAGNPSTEILYMITVTNLGPSDAQMVEVIDTLPLSGAKNQHKIVFVAETSNGACALDVATNVITCDCNATGTPSPPDWCTLPAGDAIAFEILIDTKGNLGLITNNVTVSSDTTDPNPINDEANKEMEVSGGSGNPGGPGGGRGR